MDKEILENAKNFVRLLTGEDLDDYEAQEWIKNNPDFEIQDYTLTGEAAERLDKLHDSGASSEEIMEAAMAAIESGESVIVNEYDGIKNILIKDKKYNNEDTSDTKPLSIEDLERRFRNEED